MGRRSGGPFIYALKKGDGRGTINKSSF